MAKYYQEKGETQKANEIIKAIKFQETIRENLDKVLEGKMTWEEFNK